MNNSAYYNGDDNAREKREMMNRVSKLLEALGHPLAKPVEPEEGPYVDSSKPDIPYDDTRKSRMNNEPCK